MWKFDYLCVRPRVQRPTHARKLSRSKRCIKTSTIHPRLIPFCTLLFCMRTRHRGGFLLFASSILQISQKSLIVEDVIIKSTWPVWHIESSCMSIFHQHLRSSDTLANKLLLRRPFCLCVPDLEGVFTWDVNKSRRKNPAESVPHNPTYQMSWMLRCFMWACSGMWSQMVVWKKSCYCRSLTITGKMKFIENQFWFRGKK